jgi:tRNA A-37 threonylcarbamoyl transferase component Bud32
MRNWLPPGTPIAHYVIVSPLGAGGMGEVYLAEDTRLGRKVALKLLSGSFRHDDLRVQRFQQEARAASALNHPNILTIYDIGVAGDVYYLATEHVEGQTLRKRLSAGVPEVRETLAIAVQIAGALAEAHRAGIVHRDIKPENIMVRADGIVKVLDFGIAKLMEPAAVAPNSATMTAAIDTAFGAVLGTCQYMSPEQARGHKVDARSDIFSFGAVLYEILSGRAAFQGETGSHIVVAVLENEPQPPSTLAPGLPVEVDRIVARSLRKNREERYQSAGELHADLRSLAQELELHARLRGVHEAVAAAASTGRDTAAARARRQSLVLLYKRNAEPDEQLLGFLQARLAAEGFDLFIDRHLKIGVEWAKEIESRIRAADAVVALVSESSVGSEMLEYELETAHDEYRKSGKPRILPVRIGAAAPLPGPIGAILQRFHYTLWRGAADNENTVAELVSTLSAETKGKSREITLEPVGGAVPPGSPFYIERPGDVEFLRAIEASESIILIKGPRQIGKTSLLGRGARFAQEKALRAVTTDFQKIGSAQLASEEHFYKLLAATVARQLGVTYDFANEWLDVFGAGMNMDNFLRAVLEQSRTPLVWFMDEADKLFGIPFASDFFGLVRSWHNSRATDSMGPWSRFTVVISYATEAHLFIQDLNQSPFNVGRQLLLQGFNAAQTEELNGRYGSPLASPGEVEALHDLVSGQPFLTRRALDTVQRGVMDFPTLLAQADRDDGPFGDHLKRILVAVSQLPEVLQALRQSLDNPDLREADGFHRLVSSGVMCQTGDNRIAFTCALYRRYFQLHLRQ